MAALLTSMERLAGIAQALKEVIIDKDLRRYAKRAYKQDKGLSQHLLALQYTRVCGQNDICTVHQLMM